MYGVHVVIVHNQADDLEAVHVAFLQLDKVGNFCAARPAPGSPEVEQNDLSARSGERNRLAVQSGKLKFRREIGIPDKVDRGLRLLLPPLPRVIGLSRFAARRVQQRKERGEAKDFQMVSRGGLAVRSGCHSVLSRKAYRMLDAKRRARKGRFTEGTAFLLETRRR